MCVYVQNLSVDKSLVIRLVTSMKDFFSKGEGEAEAVWIVGGNEVGGVVWK